ncbi:hypothetical protein ABH920_009685, partial [Catenulispora sp. EB89]
GRRLSVAPRAVVSTNTAGRQRVPRHATELRHPADPS